MKSRESYGKKSLSILDRFGVFLSFLAIKKYFPPSANLNVLDLGCGYYATLLVALGNRIKKGIGVDFMINAELKKKSHLSFVESSIEQAFNQLTEYTPHIIMILSVLEHLPKPATVLNACYKLLPQEGLLLINVPTWRGKFFLEFSAFKLGTSPKIEMDDHKMYYDKRDLWPMLVKAGFKPSQIHLKYHKLGLNLFAVARK